MTAARIPIVGVMGSGTRGFPELAGPVGKLVARLGCHLLTGGGGGVMAEAGRAFTETVPRRGLSIGILKGEREVRLEGKRERLIHTPAPPNPWVEIPIRTHLPLSGAQGRDVRSRNHINVLSADALVLLPGEAGTYSEAMLRIDYGRSLLLFLGGHKVDTFSANHFLAKAWDASQVKTAGSITELEELLRRELSAADLFPLEAHS